MIAFQKKYPGVIEGDSGMYYYDVCGDSNTKPFTDLKFSDGEKYRFASEVLGYTVSSGNFPHCRTMEDVEKVCNAVEERMRLDEVIRIGPYEGRLSGSRQFWTPFGSHNNDIAFHELGISDKYRFVESVLGYRPTEGVFPVLRRDADVLKVCDELDKMYKRGASYGEGSSSKEIDVVVVDHTSMLSPSKIKEKEGGILPVFINVVKS